MKIYSDRIYNVFIPDNYDNFLQLSEGTNWYMRDKEKYDSYLYRDRLYILINKKKNKKYFLQPIRGLIADANNHIQNYDDILYYRKIREVIEEENKKQAFENLKEKIKNNKINYNSIKKSSVFKFFDKREVDISFIVPVHERKEFSQHLINSLLKAKENSNKTISITFVEHSYIPQHSKICKDNKVNYIFIPFDNEEHLFNKSLAHNFGALYSNQPKEYYLFHDLDLLMEKDFFNKIEENLYNNNCNVLQCFTKGRILNLNQKTTKEILNNDISFDQVDKEQTFISERETDKRSPGGSILVDKNIFFQIGGYDPELFQAYSPEDQFFWDKLEQKVSYIYSSDNPPIELYHMWHEHQQNYNPFFEQMQEFSHAFQILDKDKKEEIINIKKEKIEDL